MKRFLPIARALARAAKNTSARAALDFITDSPLRTLPEEYAAAARAMRASLRVMAWAQVCIVILLAVIAAGVWWR